MSGNHCCSSERAGTADSMGAPGTNADSSVETGAILKQLWVGDSFAVSSEHLDETVQLIMDMPSLLLVDAHRPMNHSASPLAPQPLDAWPDCGRADIVALMARLWLLNKVVKQPTVQLSGLLGGIDVGAHEVTLRVPNSGFELEHISWQVDAEELANEADNVDTTWAYHAPANAAAGSWLLLRSEADGAVVCIQLKSRRQTQPQTHLPVQAEHMLRGQDLRHVLVVVTNYDEPMQRQAFYSRLLFPFSFRSDPRVLITPGQHEQYFGACRYLLTSALAERS